jgi:hypothetical protein
LIPKKQFIRGWVVLLNITRVSTWVWGRVSLLFVGQKAAQHWNKHEGNNVLDAK